MGIIWEMARIYYTVVGELYISMNWSGKLFLVGVVVNVGVSVVGEPTVGQTTIGEKT